MEGTPKQNATDADQREATSDDQTVDKLDKEDNLIDGEKEQLSTKDDLKTQGRTLESPLKEPLIEESEPKDQLESKDEFEKDELAKQEDDQVKTGKRLKISN